jgi:DNA-binding SARP family transcriptional activator
VPDEVVRSRVLQRLDRRWEHLVTTVTAGPGFGKSIAVGQAVRANQTQPRGIEAWLSCRSGVEDPSRLVASVGAAFGSAPAGRGPPLAQLQHIVAELAPVDAVLILDDVEALTGSPTSVELLDELLRAMPWNLHLVLCGRRLPPLALARFRAAGQVVEVTGDDLRFDELEIQALASNAGRSAPPQDVGGWPALVRLAVAAPPGSVGDFLWDEVIRTLDPPDRRALAALCLLGPCPGADLETVCGEPFDAVAFCRRVPLVHDAKEQVVAHDMWEPYLTDLLQENQLAALGRRALEVTVARNDVVATGSLAIRLDDDTALRRAAVELVRTTLTNLPLGVAAAWVRAAREPSPEIDLLAAALAHAQDAAQPSTALLDALAAEFRSRSDVDGESGCLALAAVAADATGDFARLPALAGRAEELAADHDDPILWALVDGVRAALAAAQGDIAGALQRLERDSPGRLRTETVELLHWRLLLLAGRAAEAADVGAALAGAFAERAESELEAVARWLDGDPSGFDLERVELSAERYTGVGERERFDRASFVATLAAATGEPEPVDLAVEVLTASPLAQATVPYAARVAAAVAAQRVAHHDDVGATSVIEEFLAAVDADLDPMADAFLRRSLGVPYVCSPQLRGRWDGMDLGPSQRRARAIARLMVEARTGKESLVAGPDSLAAVCTVLPLPWSVELAVRAAARGLSWGAALAEDLGDRFGPPVGAELARLRQADHEELRHGADTLARILPLTPPATLSIRVLGPLEIAQDAEPVDSPELRRGRVRELLSVLVVERSLTRDRAIDLLWPDLDGSKARANLRVTLTHLQRLLEPERPGGHPPYFVRADAEHLRLSAIPALDVDLWAVEQHLARAEDARQAGDAASRIRHLEAVLARWRGRPLPDLDGIPALTQTSGYLTSRLVDACLTLGELELTRGEVSRVVACAERALAADPYRERAHRLAIAVSLQARDRAALQQARAHLQATLDDLGVDPEETTQMLLRQAAAWLG